VLYFLIPVQLKKVVIWLDEYLCNAHQGRRESFSGSEINNRKTHFHFTQKLLKYFIIIKKCLEMHNKNCICIGQYWIFFAFFPPCDVKINILISTHVKDY